MRTRLFEVIATLALVVAFQSTALAERRVALVVGNGAYRKGLELPNAPGDARAIAAALRRLNFAVISGFDLTSGGMRELLKEFDKAVDGAELGLFFYAGHAMQVADQNYLVPIDVQPRKESELEDTIKLDVVLTRLGGAKVKMVLLDACRDNPLAEELSRSIASRSGDRTRSTATPPAAKGLSAINASSASGTFVAYATSPGRVSFDGKGSHSPFTAALLQHLETPGIDVGRVMTRVTKEVKDSTGSRQQPWISSSLDAEVYLKAVPQQAALTAPPKAPPQPAATQPTAAAPPQSIVPDPRAAPGSAPRPDGDRGAARSTNLDAIEREAENELWKIANGSNRPEDYQQYLKEFPKGRFAPAARDRLASLQSPASGWWPFGGGTAPGGPDTKTASTAPAGSARATVAPAPGPVAGQTVRIAGIVDSLPGVVSGPSRGWLGAEAESVDEAWARTLGLSEARGAFVTEVKANSPASRAGLKFGDVILGVNGQPVNAYEDLTRLVLGTAPGTPIQLDVWRLRDAGNDFLAFVSRQIEAGNVAAMRRLGVWQVRGTGVAQNATEAARLLRTASDRGDRVATLALAEMHHAGLGVDKDEIRGTKLFRAAAEAGDFNAMLALANAYMAGRGVLKDPQQAREWVMKAAQGGHLPAMYALAQMLIRGDGGPKDPAVGVSWLRKAADAKFSPAMLDLGVAYLEGIGVKQDVAVGLKWHQDAIELGYATAMYNLGAIYTNGKYLRADDKAAVSYFRMASERGSGKGMANLAVNLDQGRGTGRDSDAAAKWMLQAVEVRSPEAREAFELLVRNAQAQAWSKDFVRGLQRRLKEAGTYSGSIDGTFRQATLDAVVAYANRRR